jgi:hypothetical protein
LLSIYLNNGKIIYVLYDKLDYSVKWLILFFYRLKPKMTLVNGYRKDYNILILVNNNQKNLISLMVELGFPNIQV